MSGVLDEPFDLDAAAIDAFRRDGFVQLRAVLPRGTVARYGEAITRRTLELNTERRPLDERGTYDRAFLQVMNLWRSSPVVAEFVRSRRLAGIAARLLGVDGVRLYHDQSLYKEPGGGLTPAHADQYYWPLASDRTVTAWIPLQDVPAEMGPLEFYAGSHVVEIGRDLRISDESERRITAEMEARGFPRHAEPFAMGDVSFHLGWTFHRAGPNVSAHPRSVMTVIYMDREMRLLDDVPPAARDDWEKWCPGARCGEIVDTPLNPVLYP
jgi:ectoine hydroxylase-related dioxygenase (phytanoyl-CoA dioxygenase family)